MSWLLTKVKILVLEMKEKESATNSFLDPKKILEILREAGRQARIRHKKLGHPIVSWQDGKVVIIPPDEIVIDDNDEPAK